MSPPNPRTARHGSVRRKSLPPSGREGGGRRSKSPFCSDCAGWPPATGARAGNVRFCARDWWSSCFVNENEFRRIEIELPCEPFPASILHVSALLLLGVRRFF